LTPEARWCASLSGPSTVGAARRGRCQRSDVRAARGVADGRGHRHHRAPRLVRAAPGRSGRSITPVRAATAPSSRSTARCCQRRWQSPGFSVTSAAPSPAPTEPDAWPTSPGPTPREGPLAPSTEKRA
jgi:hypothetical protein